MKEVNPVDVKVSSPDELSMRIFNKAVELLGGPRRIISYRKLTWLASIFESALVLVLKEVFNKTAEEIAQELGISSATVRNILKADSEKVMEYLERKFREETTEEEDVHIAGGLTKKAFEVVKEELYSDR